MATVTPGRALAEAASTALLGAPTNGTAAGGNPAGAGTPYMRRTAAAEGDAGRYPVTAAFLRLLGALLARRCVDAQLHVRGLHPLWIVRVQGITRIISLEPGPYPRILARQALHAEALGRFPDCPRQSSRSPSNISPTICPDDEFEMTLTGNRGNIGLCPSYCETILTISFLDPRLGNLLEPYLTMM